MPPVIHGVGVSMSLHQADIPIPVSEAVLREGKVAWDIETSGLSGGMTGLPLVNFMRRLRAFTSFKPKNPARPT